MCIASSESFRSGRFLSILFAAILEAMNIALVLGTLTTILLLIHQSWKFFKSAFRQFVKFKTNGSEEDRVASSANRSKMQVLNDKGKSLIYTRKSNLMDLELIPEVHQQLFVFGLIVYQKYLLAENSLSVMTEIITGCYC